MPTIKPLKIAFLEGDPLPYHRVGEGARETLRRSWVGRGGDAGGEGRETSVDTQGSIICSRRPVLKSLAQERYMTDTAPESASLSSQLSELITVTDKRLWQASHCVEYLRTKNINVVDDVNLFEAHADSRLPPPSQIGLVLIGGLHADSRDNTTEGDAKRSALGWVGHKAISSAAVEYVLEKYHKTDVILASVFSDKAPTCNRDDVTVVSGFTADHWPSRNIPGLAAYSISRTNDGTERCDPADIYFYCFCRKLENLPKVCNGGLISAALLTKIALEAGERVLFFAEGDCLWSMSIHQSLCRNVCQNDLAKPICFPGSKRLHPNGPEHMTYTELGHWCEAELRKPERAERFKYIKASEWTAELWRASIPGTSSKRKRSTSQSDASNEWTLEPDVDPDIVHELEMDEN